VARPCHRLHATITGPLPQSICSTGAPNSHRSDARPHRPRSSQRGRAPTAQHGAKTGKGCGPDHARYLANLRRPAKRQSGGKNRFNHTRTARDAQTSIRSSTAPGNPFPARTSHPWRGRIQRPATIWPLCSSAMETAQCGSPVQKLVCRPTGRRSQRVVGVLAPLPRAPFLRPNQP